MSCSVHLCRCMPTYLHYSQEVKVLCDFVRSYIFIDSRGRHPSNINLGSYRHAVIHPFVFLRVSVGNARDSHDAFLAVPLGRKQVLRLFKVSLRICRNTEQHIKSNARLKCVCNQTIPYQRRPAVDLGIEMYMLNYAIPTKSIS